MGEKKKILVFLPLNPWPPRHGSHRRSLEMLEALKGLGHEVTIAGISSGRNTLWTSAGQALVTRGLARRAELHSVSFTDRAVRALHRYSRIMRGRPEGLGLNERTPPRMRRWFVRTVDRAEPEVLFMNYVLWDPLVTDHMRESLSTVVDTHDLVTLNRSMQDDVWKRLKASIKKSVVHLHTVPGELLDEGFFSGGNYQVDEEEFRTLDRYHHTIAISEPEAIRIREKCPNTETHFIPMTQSVTRTASLGRGPALFPVGPNAFNLQGYCYFALRVLPLVLAEAPGFILRVTGEFGKGLGVEAPAGIHLSGFVSDLHQVFRESSFLVCPVFGGTGQQVKIVEAMARGLPVIALKNAADRSPLVHGVSGLVARDAVEFASHVVRLWKDPDLCSAMGEAGRKAVEESFSREQLQRRLHRILSAQPEPLAGGSFPTGSGDTRAHA